MKYCLPFILLLGSFCIGLAQEIDTEVSVSSNSVQVAEPLEYSIEVYAPTGATVIFPELDSVIGRFDVLDHYDRFGIPSETTAGQSSWKRRFSIESIQTGILNIPEQKIEILLNGKRQFAITNSIEVTVESVLENRPDPMKFRDIKGLIDIDVPEEKSSSWVWWTACGAGAIAVAGLFIAFFMTRKSWTMPDQWAIQELRSISTITNNSDEIYGKMVQTLRGYLDYRYGLDPNMAKRDLVSSIKKLDSTSFDDSTNVSVLLAELLDKAEAAKFAGQKVESNQLNVDLNAAIEFVERCEQRLLNPTTQSEEP